MPIYKIDTEKVTTQAKYAQLKGVTRQAVKKWIENGTVETLKIPELGIELVVMGSEPEAVVNKRREKINKLLMLLDQEEQKASSQKENEKE